ncbi:MAG TPA: hypothetical protein VK797_03250 [Tepidisphaeraceae bacterium]|jgi:hypothetical protein|nr:hypothetical protein [Tepidisphaeraceae bacterium]
MGAKSAAFLNFAPRLLTQSAVALPTHLFKGGTPLAAAVVELRRGAGMAHGG